MAEENLETARKQLNESSEGRIALGMIDDWFGTRVIGTKIDRQALVRIMELAIISESMDIERPAE